MTLYTLKELRALPALAEGQCCDLKVETESLRVWLCRVGGGVTVERLIDGKWRKRHGGCVA